MIDLKNIYSKTLSELVKNTCVGDVYIKLIVESELDELIQKMPYEQIAYCLLDENGNRHFDDELAIEIKKQMPLAHQNELCDTIMKVNKFGITQEEVEKN